MSRKNHAFTVMELLLAISVVAVLAVLLAAATLVVRRSAETARCVNRLRQVGGALQAYSGDFNQRILPRYANDVGAKEPQGWPRRLLSLGYLSNPESVLCPSFTPRSTAESTRAAATTDASEAFGMRSWVAPGDAWSSTTSLHKPLTAIAEPSEFFMAADSLWINWNSQGYGITPGSVNQAVHLRHQGKANTLFADGHVEAKPASYFREIQTTQKAYTGGKVLEIVLVDADGRTISPP